MDRNKVNGVMLRRLFGIALVVIAILISVVLQLGWGAVFGTRVVREGPEPPVKFGNMTVQVEETTVYHADLNWPVAVPLVSVVVGGAVLAALPRRKRLRSLAE